MIPVPRMHMKIEYIPTGGDMNNKLFGKIKNESKKHYILD